jgi:hypothetical protein
VLPVTWRGVGRKEARCIPRQALTWPLLLGGILPRLPGSEQQRLLRRERSPDLIGQAVYIHGLDTRQGSDAVRRLPRCGHDYDPRRKMMDNMRTLGQLASDGPAAIEDDEHLLLVHLSCLSVITCAITCEPCMPIRRGQQAAELLDERGTSSLLCYRVGVSRFAEPSALLDTFRV